MTQASLFTSPAAADDLWGDRPPAPTPAAPAGPVASPAPQAPVSAPEPSTVDVVVVDGNNITHRAWHAGQCAGLSDAPRGIARAISMIAQIVDRVDPARIVVGFDGNAASRRIAAPDYKAGRSDKDPGLVEVLAQLPGILDQLGVTVCHPADAEADDVAAQVASDAPADWTVVIATSDKDSFGLIDDRTSVLWIANGVDDAPTVTPALLESKWEVPAGRWLEYAALRGDRSDNLPGPTGIGEKTAKKLLACTSHVNDVFADPDAYRAPVGNAAITKLVAGRDLLDVNLVVMSPLPVTLPAFDTLAGRPTDTAAAEQTLTAAGLRSASDVARRLCRPVPASGGIDRYLDRYADTYAAADGDPGPDEPADDGWGEWTGGGQLPADPAPLLGPTVDSIF